MVALHKYGRKEFQKFPTSINILPKQDYNGSFGKNTFGKGNFSRQMASKCSWVLHFYSGGIFTTWNTSLWSLPEKYWRTYWSEETHLDNVQYPFELIYSLKETWGKYITPRQGKCGLIWCSQYRRYPQPIRTFLLKTNSVTGGQACIIIHTYTICSTQQNIHPKMFQHLLCLLKIKLTKGWP